MYGVRVRGGGVPECMGLGLGLGLGFERERGLYTEGRLEIMFPCVYPGHGHSVYA